jgi:hypothetical protein
MEKVNINKLIALYFVSILILVTLFLNGIKTLNMISIIINIFGVLGTFILNKPNTNKELLTVEVISFVVVICLLSNIFDNILEKNIVQASIISEGSISDSVIQNESVPKDVPKEITTAVSFRSPNEIEKELENKVSYYPKLSNDLKQILLFLDQTIIADICDVSDYYTKSIIILEERINDINK